MKTCHSKRLEKKKILFSQIQPLPNAQFLQVTPQLTIYPLQTTQALLLVIKSPALHSTSHLTSNKLCFWSWHNIKTQIAKSTVPFFGDHLLIMFIVNCSKCETKPVKNVTGVNTQKKF